MAQPVSAREKVLPPEAADLATVASALIEADPRNRRAIAELAASLALPLGGPTASTIEANAALPTLVAAASTILRSRIAQPRSAAALPHEERALWEDAGAAFDNLAVEADVVRSSIRFAELIARSLHGDSAVADRLGVDRSRVSQRVTARSLYGFRFDGSRYFPRWQFTEDSTLQGLQELVAMLDPTLHPLVVDHWVSTPSVDLEIDGIPVSPLAWLQNGGPAPRLVDLAKDL